MRKFFMLVAIAGLALLVAVPAMALDFKFGAEYRVRFYTNSNGSQGGLGNNEGIANPAAPTGTFNPLSGSPGTQRGVQVRVRPRFDVSDDNGNMTATLRLEIGDIEWGNGGGANGVANGAQGTIANGARTGNGSGGMLGVDGVNVETKWAYVDFATPWGVPLRWRAGLQPWYESKGIFVDDDVAGLRAYGKAGIASYEVGWYRASGGPCTNTVPTTSPNTGLNACSTSNLLDNNYDFYEAARAQLRTGFVQASYLAAAAEDACCAGDRSGGDASCPDCPLGVACACCAVRGVVHVAMPRVAPASSSGEAVPVAAAEPSLGARGTDIFHPPRA